MQLESGPAYAGRINLPSGGRSVPQFDDSAPGAKPADVAAAVHGAELVVEAPVVAMPDGCCGVIHLAKDTKLRGLSYLWS